MSTDNEVPCIYQMTVFVDGEMVTKLGRPLDITRARWRTHLGLKLAMKRIERWGRQNPHLRDTARFGLVSIYQ